MRQGDLFDDLYVEQQTDERHIHPGHMGCEVLYQGPIEGVIKQRLVTYAKDEFGNIKRIEKVRNFMNSKFHDFTTVEVIK